MRVLVRKIHCPSFICFCKPSPSIYRPGPLKLENTPHAPSTAVVSVGNASSADGHVVPEDSSTQLQEDKSVDVDGKQSQSQSQSQPQPENPLKSSLRKASPRPREVEKKKVQWIDTLGKELADIREFEASETEDAAHEDQNFKACLCAIL
ncbi:hypothetical protein Tsubulata_040845 [Turnera subulata]|uniref:Uncharacterized protein n=1 Tax=Turnera subulata TaxID=218843 RepID=A0A9Q0JDV6_9ROSI|nr:hypothetical protein Tsubulata_040845 [Turnera subulata]